eukprot:gene2766-5450_t
MEAATQHLKSRIDNETDIGVEQIRNITCQITDCLNVIHKKGFVHGDIKPSNILERGNVFTLSKLEASSNIADKHFACTTKYSTGYLPPEMFWIDQSVIEVALENVTNLIISIIISNKRRRKEEINDYNNDYDIKNEIEEKNKIISKMKFRNDILKRSLEDQMKVDEELQLELEDKNRTILELQELIRVQNEELEELKRSNLDYLSTNGTLQGIVVYQKKKMMELQKTINDLRLEHSMPLLQEGQDANSSTSTNTSKEEIIPIESQKII